MSRLTVFGLDGIPEITVGADLAGLIAEAAMLGNDTELADGDVVVVTQKIVSKAEDRLVPVDPDDPLSHKPLVEQESVRILRRRGDLIISETSPRLRLRQRRHRPVQRRAGVRRPAARGLRPIGPPHPRRPAPPGRRRGRR